MFKLFSAFLQVSSFLTLHIILIADFPRTNTGSTVVYEQFPQNIV